MSEQQEKRQIDLSYDYNAIAQERVLWAIRPIMAVCLVVWCIHPDTTMEDILERNSLLGFLFGAVYGLFIFRTKLLNYVIIRRRETTHRRNRFPDEYYFGKIKEIMQWEGESRK